MTAAPVLVSRDRVASSREDFIRMARESELRFVGAEDEGRLTVAIHVGPWRCTACGYKTRSAGAMWDHSVACDASNARRERGQLSLFGG